MILKKEILERTVINFFHSKIIFLKKYTLLLLFTVFFVITIKGQLPVYEWAKKAGSGAGGNDEGVAIKIDASGNSLIAGFYKGVMDIDPSANNYNLISYNTSTDFFLAKYTSSGSLLWANGIGGLYNDQVRSMDLDNLGNIYVAGTFSGTVDFDPSSQSYNLTAGAQDVFFAKYDVNGNFVWVKKINSPFSINVFSIDLDNNNSIIIAGQFSGNVDFDPSAAVVNLNSVGGSLDGFIAKYDNNGNHIWSKNFGGNNSESCSGIITDSLGNIFATGTFNSISNLSPLPATFTVNSVAFSADIFLSAFDANGNFIWAKTIGGSNIETPYQIVLDYNKNILITGIYYGTGDYDPSPTINNLSWTGSSDIFIAKYDSLGNYLWANGIGGNDFEYSNSLVTDNAGNVYITGSFEGSVDFDPSTSNALLNSVTFTKDIFLAKYNAAGNYLWAEKFGSASGEQGNYVTIDNLSNIRLTGGINGTVDFDPSPATYTLSNFNPLISSPSYAFFCSKYLSANGAFLSAFAAYDDVGGSDVATCIKKDNLGNVYVCGSFNGIVDFDPSLTASYLKTNGYDDGFIAKYSPLGSLLWAKSIGGKLMDNTNALTLDNAGNCYVTGWFNDTCRFDQAIPSATISAMGGGGDDIYIAKFDNNGNYIWSKAMGGNSLDRGITIAFDNVNNIFVSGVYSGTADLDPTPALLNTLSAGDWDIFISKFDLNGNFIFSKHIGGSAYDEPGSIAVDNNGDVVLTGEFSAWADLDPGSNLVAVTSQGDYDIFIAKYDQNGIFYWAKRIGDTGTDISKCIVVDNNNRYIITGTFMSTVDFDPATFTTNNLSSLGGVDGYLAKFDGNGNHLWAYNIVSGIGNSFCNGLDKDANNNIYVTGAFAGSTDFNPSTANVFLTSVLYDSFVAKYDSVCTYQWVIKAGGTDNDIGYSIATDLNSFYSAGYFKKEVDFDFSVNESNMASAGEEDIYILKYKECAVTNLSVTQNTITCFGLNNGNATVTATGGSGFSYLWNPGGFTTPIINNLAAGSYSCVVTNSCGYTNTVSTNITQPSSLTLNAIPLTSTICAGLPANLSANLTGGIGPYTYTWSNGANTSFNNFTPTSSSIITVFVADANNCSKSSTLNVTVVSNPTVSLNSSTTTICAGGSVTLSASGANSYFWNPTSATTSSIVTFPPGTLIYSVTGSDANNCTDTKSVFITVLPLPNISVSSSASMICIGNSATLNVTGAATYTWDSGSNGISVSVTPTVNTTYTVAGTDGFGCVNTVFYTQNVSICTDLEKENLGSIKISIYPNPNNGQFYISEFENNIGKDVEVYNSIGQLIKQVKIESSIQHIDNNENAKGFYFVIIKDGNKILNVSKIIKE